MLKLSKKDWKVLFELEKDAHQSVQGIAKRVGLSKQLVSYMLKKYEDQGIILAYTAVIDSSRLGYYTYRVYLKLRELNLKDKMEDFLNFLVKIPETTIVNELDGSWDVGLTISVTNVFDFYTVWERIMAYRSFIEDYKISVYSPIYHFTRKIIVPEIHKSENQVRILGSNLKVEHSPDDVKILKVLAKNVRQPIIEIADKVKRSVPFVIKRIKFMEKSGIIQGYRPLFNWSLLGYQYYKIDLNLNSHKRNEELFSYCENNKNVIQVNKTIGGSDFEFEVYVQSKEELDKLMVEVKEKFSNVLINYSHFTVSRPYKETFMAF
ncbi:Lrp/AsnC family transcriptional regulator [Candidatus Pacearchaeota archaeon]|nr:Lrp/AsnC family transcriptional regulator [Candidatus Pacearchaeota archaeon]